MTVRLTTLLNDLLEARVPLVHATVVRAQRPTSAHPGDEAIITADGTMEGFVGGDCARESVRAAALDVLRDGAAVLLRVLPDGAAAFPESPGARVVVNPCLSGGALEIFLEPRLPPPLIRVIGTTPIAEAVGLLAGVLGFSVLGAVPGEADSDRAGEAVAVVVSTLGGDEASSIRAALAAGTGFVGLVASPRRGAGVLAGLELSDAERARVRTPVGLDIGARSAEEIALSIMAEVVRAIRVEGLRAPAAGASAAGVAARPTQVLDPVCGMTVVVVAGTPTLNVNGHDHWFCSVGCRDTFAHGAGAGGGATGAGGRQRGGH